MPNVKVQMPNEITKFQMSNSKCQITDDEDGHGYETRTRESMSKLGILGKPEKRTLSEGECGQHPLCGEERLSRISRVTSEALDGRNKRVHR